jgi:hypothetical protein
MEDLDLTHRDESKGFMVMFKNRVICMFTNLDYSITV